MSNETNLLPCPFCGGRDLSEPAKHGSHYQLKCHTCQVVISDDRQDKVVSKWNMRNVVCVGKEVIYLQPKDTTDNILYPVSSARMLFESIVHELALFVLPPDAQAAAWPKALIEAKLISNKFIVLCDFIKSKIPHAKRHNHGKRKEKKKKA